MKKLLCANGFFGCDFHHKEETQCFNYGKNRESIESTRKRVCPRIDCYAHINSACSCCPTQCKAKYKYAFHIFHSATYHLLDVIACSSACISTRTKSLW